MGTYLSRPETSKESFDGENDRFLYGASSMQGWRISQEDALSCIPDFDKDMALFAVFDGHGNCKISRYCADKLPEYIKSTPKYSKGDLFGALEQAFIGFDRALRPLSSDSLDGYDSTIEKFEEDSKKKKKRGEDDLSELELLKQEASKPLEVLIAGYKNQSSNEEDEIEKAGPSCSSDYSDHLRSPIEGSSASLVGPKISDRSEPSSSSSPTPLKEFDLLPSSSTMTSDKVDTCKVSSSKSSGENVQAGQGNVEASGSEPGPSNVGNSNTSTSSEASSTTCCVPTAEESECSAIAAGESGDDDSEPSSSNSKNKQLLLKLKLGLDLAPDKYKYCDFIFKAFLQNPANKQNSDEEGGSDDDKREDDDSDSEIEYQQDDDSDSGEEEEDGEDEDSEEDDDEDEDDEDEDEEGDDEDEDEEEEEEDGAGNGDQKEEFEGDNDIKNSPAFLSGTTAVVAIVKNDLVYVANAGDSRCVLSRNGEAIDMSIDHKPTNKKERTRIKNAGGSVFDGRVNGGLNLSRAIGDHKYKMNSELCLKNQIISAFPDVRCFKLRPEEDEFMVLACDGIWNSYRSQGVVTFVRERLQKGEKPSDICSQLFDSCLAPDTYGDGTGCDNMTCIIVKFKDIPRTNESEVRKPHKVLENVDPDQEPSDFEDYCEEEQEHDKNENGDSHEDVNDAEDDEAVDRNDEVVGEAPKVNIEAESEGRLDQQKEKANSKIKAPNGSNCDEPQAKRIKLAD